MVAFTDQRVEEASRHTQLDTALAKPTLCDVCLGNSNFCKTERKSSVRSIFNHKVMHIVQVFGRNVVVIGHLMGSINNSHASLRPCPKALCRRLTGEPFLCSVTGIASTFDATYVPGCHMVVMIYRELRRRCPVDLQQFDFIMILLMKIASHFPFTSGLPPSQGGRYEGFGNNQMMNTKPAAPNTIYDDAMKALMSVSPTTFFVFRFWSIIRSQCSQPIHALVNMLGPERFCEENLAGY